MAKLVGVGAVKKVKTYTEEEVKKIISDKEAKIEELTKEVELLKTEKKTK